MGEAGGRAGEPAVDRPDPEAVHLPDVPAAAADEHASLDGAAGHLDPSLVVHAVRVPGECSVILRGLPSQADLPVRRGSAVRVWTRLSGRLTVKVKALTPLASPGPRSGACALGAVAIRNPTSRAVCGAGPWQLILLCGVDPSLWKTGPSDWTPGNSTASDWNHPEVRPSPGCDRIPDVELGMGGMARNECATPHDRAFLPWCAACARYHLQGIRSSIFLSKRLNYIPLISLNYFHICL